MSRFCIVLLIAIMMATTLPAVCQAYEPPTDAELMTWWNSLTTELKIDTIRRLDIIEHSMPVFSRFEFAAALLNTGDLIIFITEPIIMSLHDLSYSIEFKPVTIKGFSEPQADWVRFISIPLIVSGTSLASALISGADSPWQYVAAGTLGLGIGVVIDLLFP